MSRHIGRGLNRWSHVHIGDVAELYLLALEKAPAGSFYYVENGESTLLEIARDIARHLNVAGPEPVTFEEAVTIWGRPSALYGLGSNSRVRADRARNELGWNPGKVRYFTISLARQPSIDSSAPRIGGARDEKWSARRPSLQFLTRLKRARPAREPPPPPPHNRVRCH